LNNELIKFANVSIGYGNKSVLENLSFAIFTNDFLGIVGPNGSGKTTLLKSLIGNLKPLKGEIIREKIQFGYVPQRDVIQPLLPYSVHDVVMMGRFSLMGTLKNPTSEDKEIVDECLSHVGIQELKNQSYNRLSGGQRQRTLIARALAVHPKVLILDEPTNGMDTPSHYSLLELISQLHNEGNLTVLIVSHLLTDVANIVKRLVLLEKDHFQVGNIEDILSEHNLKKTYASEFNVSKIDGEYLITSRKKE
jgi:ABC-type Mn2+/Zn2+ transport system ATPase subunit